MRDTHRQIRDEEAARLDREAQAADQRAAQNRRKAEQESVAGKLSSSVMWEAAASRDAQEADRLRKEARDMRSGKTLLW